MGPSSVLSKVPSRRAAACLAAVLAVTLFAEETRAQTSSPQPGVLLVPVAEGRRMALSCRGEGVPTVVVDAGLGTPGIGSVWEPIADRIGAVTRVCLYDRANLGLSEGTREFGRSSGEVVADLRLALALAGEWGPYVLVGHAVGGLNMLFFAHHHPEAVAALVLVDSTHPDQTARWLKALPAAVEGEAPSVTTARDYLEGLATRPTANPERLDLGRVSDEARAVTHISVPLVVLTQSSNWRMAPDLPEAVAARLEEVAQALQSELLSLAEDSERLVSRTGGHDLPADDPDLVAAAVIRTVDRVRNASTAPPDVKK